MFQVEKSKSVNLMPKLIGKSILFASMQFAIGSVEMSSKFSVKNFSKDQDTLQNAADALDEIDEEDLITALPVRRPIAIGLLPGARPAPLVAPVQVAQATVPAPSAPASQVTAVAKAVPSSMGASMPLPPPRPMSLGLIR